jgi:hypothetical protein
MLVGMDIPAAAAAPWLALGVVLGILLLGLVGLGAALLLRRPDPGGPPTTPARSDDPGDDARDDLAGFLEHPPGSAGGPELPAEGWAVLALSAPVPHSVPDPTPEPVAVGRSAPGSGTRRVLAAMAVAALLLVAAAAAVATGLPVRGPGEPAAASSAGMRSPEGLEAHLSFGGVVLERRAVGVTASYPELLLTGEGAGSDLRASVRLPTWNCLTDEPPGDPVAAGCRRTVPEYGDLATPALEVVRTHDGLRIAGRFPTETRPNGSAPAPTGRVYELAVTVVAGNRPRNGWLPASGVLELGADRTETTGTDVAAGVNVLRYGDR